jgi:hypothetical protein
MACLGADLPSHLRAVLTTRFRRCEGKRGDQERSPLLKKSDTNHGSCLLHRSLGFRGDRCFRQRRGSAGTAPAEPFRFRSPSYPSARRSGDHARRIRIGGRRAAREIRVHLATHFRRVFSLGTWPRRRGPTRGAAVRPRTLSRRRKGSFRGFSARMLEKAAAGRRSGGGAPVPGSHGSSQPLTRFPLKFTLRWYLATQTAGRTGSWRGRAPAVRAISDPRKSGASRSSYPVPPPLPRPDQRQFDAGGVSGRLQHCRPDSASNFVVSTGPAPGRTLSAAQRRF